jgi:hypothetical protein
VSVCKSSALAGPADEVASDNEDFVSVDLNEELGRQVAVLLLLKWPIALMGRLGLYTM